LNARGGGGHAPTAIAVVLDNSLSTSVIVGGRPVLARLKEAVNAVLTQVSAGDRVWLLTADGTVHGGTAAAVRAALGRTDALAGAGDPPSAAARGSALASALARSAGLGDAVVAVATDGQATTWNSPLQTRAADAGRTVVYVPSGAPPANHAVADVQAQPIRWTPRGAIVARLTGITDSASYRIDLNGRTLARGTASAGDPLVSVHAAPAARAACRSSPTNCGPMTSGISRFGSGRRRSSPSIRVRDRSCVMRSRHWSAPGARRRAAKVVAS